MLGPRDIRTVRTYNDTNCKSLLNSSIVSRYCVPRDVYKVLLCPELDQRDVFKFYPIMIHVLRGVFKVIPNHGTMYMFHVTSLKFHTIMILVQSDVCKFRHYNDSIFYVMSMQPCSVTWYVFNMKYQMKNASKKYSMELQPIMSVGTCICVPMTYLHNMFSGYLMRRYLPNALIHYLCFVEVPIKAFHQWRFFSFTSVVNGKDEIQTFLLDKNMVSVSTKLGIGILCHLENTKIHLSHLSGSIIRVVNIILEFWLRHMPSGNTV